MYRCKYKGAAFVLSVSHFWEKGDAFGIERVLLLIKKYKQEI
jgi:hypothetical protein